MKNNAFLGQNSLKSFLDPSNHQPPLVELPQALNPFANKGVRICAKLMPFLPLGNVKSIPAYNMINEMAENDGLAGKDTIIECSSGNTAASLAVTGRQFGLRETKALVSFKTSRAKIQLLRFFGVEVHVTHDMISPDQTRSNSGIYQAKRLAEQNDSWVNPGQYHNPANPAAHAKWTGPQIWQQTSGKVSVFCAGVGSTGTLMGTAEYLRTQNSEIKIIGVSRKAHNLVPGVRTVRMLEEVKYDWQSATDKLVEVDAHESYDLSLRLCRYGILAGPSGGFAYAGLLHYLVNMQQSGQLDGLQNKDGKIFAVFIVPDAPWMYIHDYFENLDQSYFPSVHNQDLLRQSSAVNNYGQSTAETDILVDQAITRLYQMAPAELVKTGPEAALQPYIRLIDIRASSEFKNGHLPGAENIPSSKLMKDISSNLGENDREIVFIGSQESPSMPLTTRARRSGYTAYNLSGGIAVWVQRNLPLVSLKAKSQ